MIANADNAEDTIVYLNDALERFLQAAEADIQEKLPHSPNAR